MKEKMERTHNTSVFLQTISSSDAAAPVRRHVVSSLQIFTGCVVPGMMPRRDVSAHVSSLEARSIFKISLVTDNDNATAQ